MICRVTGKFYLPTGQPVRNRCFILHQNPEQVVAGHLGGIAPMDTVVKIDNSGNVDFNIISGNYIGTMDLTHSKSTFTFPVPNQPTADIADILSAATPVEPLPVWLQQVLEARDDAEGFAQDAEGSADRAEVARDAAIDAGSWDYKPANAAALSAITGMTSGQTALVLDTMHVWRYNGTSWVDTGESPLAGKASLADVADAMRAAHSASLKPGWRLDTSDTDLDVTVAATGAVSSALALSVADESLRLTNAATAWPTTLLVDVVLNSQTGSDTIDLAARLVSASSTAWVGLSFGAFGSTRRHVTIASTGAVIIYNDAGDEVLPRPIPASGALAYTAGQTAGLRITRQADGSAEILATGPNGAQVSASLAAGSLPAGPVWICEKAPAVYDILGLNTWGMSDDLADRLDGKAGEAELRAATARLGSEMDVADANVQRERGDGGTIAGWSFIPAPGGLQSAPAASAIVYMHYIGTGYVKASGGRDRYEARLKFTAQTNAATVAIAVGDRGADRRTLCWSRQGAVQTRRDNDGSVHVFSNETSALAWGLNDDVRLILDYSPDNKIAARGFVNDVQVWAYDLTGLMLSEGPVWLGQRGVNTMLIEGFETVGYPDFYEEELNPGAPFVPLVAPIITGANISATGLSLAISADLQVTDETVKKTQVAGSVTLDATATGAVTDDAPQLVTLMTSAARFPAHRHLSGVVVKRASDDETLTITTDYTFAPASAWFYAANSGAAVPVKITYGYIRERYDAVGLDMDTRAIVVAQGVERNNDAGEYLPMYPSGSLPICMVKVVGSSVSVVETWRYSDGAAVRDTGERERLKQRNQGLMMPVIAKLTSGSNLKITGYGDSITQLTSSLFSVRYPADTQAAILAEVGSYGNAGWGGRLAARLDSMWQGDVTYLNRGVSGSTSAQGAANPRLSDAVAENPDLVLICFGMNDLSNPANFRQNLRTMVQAFRDGGAVPVVISIPWKLTTLSTQVDELAAMTRRARMVAQEENVPFVDLSFCAAWPWFQPSMGLVRTDMGACDLSVHPGWRELRRYADELIYQVGL